MCLLTTIILIRLKQLDMNQRHAYRVINFTFDGQPILMSDDKFTIEIRTLVIFSVSNYFDSDYVLVRFIFLLILVNFKNLFEFMKNHLLNYFHTMKNYHIKHFKWFVNGFS